MNGVRVLVGTRKGAFILTADAVRPSVATCTPTADGMTLGWLHHDDTERPLVGRRHVHEPRGVAAPGRLRGPSLVA